MRLAALAALALAACSQASSGGKDLSHGNPDLTGGSDVDFASPDDDLSTSNRVDMTGNAGGDLAGVVSDDMMNDLAVVTDLSTIMTNDLTGGVRGDIGSPPDLLGATAWGQPCTAGTACATPTGEIGYCSLAYGHPVCLHTCDNTTELTLCEGGAGVCAFDGVGNTCFPKCGDATSINCAAGASCAYVGFLTASGKDVGICVPDCGSGADSCNAAGRVCDTVRRDCVDTTCPGGCLTGSTCTAGVCVPNTPKAIYAACTPSTTAANGCASDLCFAVGTSPGFCGVFCNSDNADIVCGAGGVCWGDNNRTLDNGAVSGDVTGAGLGQFVSVGGRTSGACTKRCATTADCPTGAYCAEWNGVRGCMFEAALPVATLPAVGTGTPGQLCRAANQCASGSCVIPTGYADGICLKAAAAVCPGNTTANATANVCLLNCDATQALQCNGSQVCDDVFSTPSSQCRPGLVCRSNADCAAGYTCDPGSGECLNAALPGAGVIGVACTTGANCAGDFCLTPTDGFPLGYCSASCTQLPDFSDTCPSGALCVGFGNFAVGSVGVCADLCDASVSVSKFGGCRASYKCTALAANANVGFCEPM